MSSSSSSSSSRKMAFKMKDITPMDSLILECSESATPREDPVVLEEDEAAPPPPPSEGSLSTVLQLATDLKEYIKLLAQVHPRAFGTGVICVAIFCLIVVITSLAGRPPPRNHLEGDYTTLHGMEKKDIERAYQEQKEQIHHWCLFGGNDKCYCEDPTLGQSREEARGWSETHNRNKHMIAQDKLVQHGGTLDVVFVGDQTFQAWGQGKFLDRSFSEGPKISSYFNETFRYGDDGIHGLALGAYTDRVSFVFELTEYDLKL
jgi:hypothetical protein